MSWRSATIGDVLTLQRGYDITRASQTAGTVPVVSSGGVASYHSVPISDGPGVVIGRKGTLGKVFYVEGPYWPHDTTLWVSDFKGSNPRFVYYFLKTLDVSFLDVGSANPTLNRNHVHPLPVLWPPIPTQRAIAEVLGALDDKIAANEGLARAVDGLCEALFDRFAALPRTTLASVAVVNDQSLKPGHGSVRYLDISSVSVGGYAWPDVIDWAEAPSRARRLVKPGDTVWSTVRPNRRSHALVLDSGLVGSTGLAVITPSNAGPAFVYQATKTPEFTSYLEGVAEGSAYPAVRAERFLDAPIPQVDPGRRSWFEESAYAMRQRVHATAQESRALAELRDTLLPHLMSGRLTVREAEKQVAEVL